MYSVYLLFIDWIKNSDENFSKHWPGWDTRIIETNAKEEYNIRDIGMYGMIVNHNNYSELEIRIRN